MCRWSNPRSTSRRGCGTPPTPWRNSPSKLGVPPQHLVDTVARFNEFVARGVDDDFGRGDEAYDRAFSVGRRRCMPIEKAPFHAAAFGISDLGTKGGLRTDTAARVLDAYGNPIPGLYAAGNTMAAPSGTAYPGRRQSDRRAMVFSHLAARHMAATERRVDKRLTSAPFHANIAPWHLFSDTGIVVSSSPAVVPASGRRPCCAYWTKAARWSRADISESGLKDTAAKAEPHRDRLSTVVMDVGDERRCSLASRRRSRPSAGSTPWSTPPGSCGQRISPTPRSPISRQVLRINLVGTFLVIRAAIPALRSGNDPAVVNFSSTSASFAHPYMAAYAASKGGVQAMTHALALEFVKERIRFELGSAGIRSRPV